MKIETGSEPRNYVSAGSRPLDVAAKRALVVDEEPAMCALIQEVLASAGIETVSLAKSDDANAHFQEEKFDVILVDVCAPSETGIELIRKLRKSGFNQMTPIIMMSDDQSPGALSRGFAAGASFFVYKPIDKPRLVSLIRVIQGTIEHERRRFRRIPVQARVRIKSDSAEVTGETIDISLNGALVRTSRTLPLGALVEVSLYLFEGMKPVVGLGSVMRIVSGSQMGILLDRFPVAEIARLQEFLLPRIAD
jgi:DNA-binding response OmpR family regulator